MSCSAQRTTHEYLILMAASFLLRGHSLLRSGCRQSGLYTGILTAARRSWCTATAAPTPPDTDSNLSSAEITTSLLSASELPKFQRSDDPDHRNWQVHEEEILSYVRPIISLAKDILHSYRYVDGERLTFEDERFVADRLLVHHPNAEDKIGCGLESIMVDRHPQFRSRCLFVVRTDGGRIDFSYLKCIKAYIQNKYPSYAERFIREHFKRRRFVFGKRNV